MTMTTARIVVGDDHVGTEHANLQHHAPQHFFLIPGAKRLFSRLRKAKIAKAKEVRLRALHCGGGPCFASANDAELFVKLRTDSVLSAFTKRGEKRDSVDSVLAAENRERAAVFIVRMRGDTHHGPGTREIEQR